MAYMNQEKKAKIASVLKPILAKYGIKGSLSVHNHSSISLNIKSGPIDFIENFIATDSNVMHGRKMSADQIAYIRKDQSLDVNPYWYQDHFSGIAKKALSEILPAMYSADYYDNSDAQVDYFDTAYYVHVKIGKWNKPYQVVA